jgi:adenylate kinase/ribonuclease R
MKSIKKSNVRIYLKPGGLKEYHIKDTMKTRRSILKKLLRKDSYSTIIKRLNVLSIYNKNRYPEISKKVKSDISYIQKNFYNKSLSKKRSIKKRMSKKRSIKKRMSKKRMSKKRSIKKLKSMKKRSKKKSSMKKLKSIKKRSKKKSSIKKGGRMGCGMGCGRMGCGRMGCGFL